MTRIVPRLGCVRLGGLLLAAAVGLASSASAGDEMGPPGTRRFHRGPPPIERMLERHAQRLGLDGATRAEIRHIAEAAEPQSLELHERLRELHGEMRRLLGQDAPDVAAVMGQAERIGALEIELQQHRLRTMLQVRALLTREQRQELVRIHEEMRAKRRGFRGGREEPPSEPPVEPR